MCAGGRLRGVRLRNSAFYQDVLVELTLHNTNRDIVVPGERVGLFRSVGRIGDASHKAE